jgi:protein phosphatase
VRGSVFGLPLQKMVERSDIALTDLPQTTRRTVQDGILVTDDGLAGARERVAVLRDTRLAPCPVPGQPPAAQPSADLSTAPDTAAPALPVPTAAPLPTDPAATAVPTDPALGGLPPTAAPASGADTTPLPSFVPEPGLNCRPVG